MRFYGAVLNILSSIYKCVCYRLMKWIHFYAFSLYAFVYDSFIRFIQYSNCKKADYFNFSKSLSELKCFQSISRNQIHI